MPGSRGLARPPPSLTAMAVDALIFAAEDAGATAPQLWPSGSSASSGTRWSTAAAALGDGVSAAAA
ncbi:hypothetical protein OG698_04145 [Streptomyces sp. NBC_01003]|uniref:hypothetical protein n=1 Tax=Streptomyces sp. NBC_01003 TaxID=2903714 RepID=UPI00386CD224|nr:hypothetical protein OG698_04145 [Streptomyces sp. NBC_01003]